MIKMFVMPTCPDCEYVEKQVEGNPEFEVIDMIATFFALTVSEK